MKKLFCIILITTQICAIADTDPYFAQKGQALTQDSWVFSPAKTLETRNKLIDLETALGQIESYKKTIKSYQESEELSKKQLDLSMEQNDKLAKSLSSERTMTSLERIVWVFFGIAATVGAFYAAKAAR